MAVVFAGEVPHVYHTIALLLVIAGIVVSERFRPVAA